MSSNHYQSPPSIFSIFTILFFFFIFLPPLAINAHTCTEEFLTEVHKLGVTQSCQKKTLRVEFAWNFNSHNRQLDIAFGARLDTDSGWLAWGLNPVGPHMVGTRALIGIKQLNSSPLMWRRYNITAFTKLGCPLLPVAAGEDFGLDVRHFSFFYMKEIEYYVIRAAVVLPGEYNSSRANIVWQIGADVAAGGEPGMHPRSLGNFDCADTIDLNSDRAGSYKAHQRRRIRTAHGVLNIVGWGTLLPMGVIVARYFRKFPTQWPGWFAFHVSCQSAGYILGSSGWGVGLWLGRNSIYYHFPTHRILAIIIFTFTTIQMLALRLMPKGTDEYRTYWNMYHHFLGYGLLAVISVNIFEGIKIWQQEDHAWKWAYIGILGVLGGVALALEVYTWIKFVYMKDNNNAGSQNAPQQPQPIEDLTVMVV